MTRPTFLAVSVAAALMFLPAGCAVGPAYRRPAVPVPARWSNELARGTEPGGGPAGADWWNSFHDPELESLVRRAVAANLDLKIAAARVEEARATRGGVRSNALPQVNTGYAAATTRQVLLGLAPAPFPYQTGLYQGQFDLSWEADVFGRIRQQFRAATMDAAAQEEGRRNVLITLLGDTAMNYAQVRGFQLRLHIAERNIAIQQDTLDLTRTLERAGQTTARDVAQAEAQLEATRAGVPQLETGRDVAMHRLGVLLGAEPGSLREELAAAAPLPVIPAEVPVGLPSDLLERRP